jgi:hypothetical protein
MLSHVDYMQKASKLQSCPINCPGYKTDTYNLSTMRCKAFGAKRMQEVHNIIF